MKKTLLIIILIFIAIFFIGPNPNYKYDVNYIRADRHLINIATYPRSTESETNNFINYVKEELMMYNYEVTVSDNKDIIVPIPSVDPTNSKNVLFISQYNTMPHLTGAADNAVAISSMLDTLQVLANRVPKNNVDVKFANIDNFDLYAIQNSLTTADYEKYDHIFIFDSKGINGDLYIYNSSYINSDIIKFYKDALSTPTSFSLLANSYKKLEPENTQVIALGMFEKKYNNLSANDNIYNISNITKTNYNNTVYELLSGAYNNEFTNTNNHLNYTTYFDAFITFNLSEVAFLFLIIAILLIIFFTSEKTFEIKKILLSFLPIIASAGAAILLVIIPFINLLKYYSISYQNHEIYSGVAANLQYTLVAISTIAIIYILVYILLRKFHLSNIYLFSANIIVSTLLLIAYYYFFNKSINNLVLFSIFVNSLNMLLTYKQIRFNNLIKVIELIIIIPILVNTTYFIIQVLPFSGLNILLLYCAYIIAMIMPTILSINNQKEYLN